MVKFSKILQNLTNIKPCYLQNDVLSYNASMINTQVSTLLRAKKITQTKVVKDLSISMTSLNKFLNGPSQLGSGSLTKLLKLLNIDLRTIIQEELIKTTDSTPHVDKKLCGGFSKIFANLDNNLKVSIIDSFIRDAKSNTNVDLAEEIIELKNWKAHYSQMSSGKDI